MAATFLSNLPEEIFKGVLLDFLSCNEIIWLLYIQKETFKGVHGDDARHWPLMNFCRATHPIVIFINFKIANVRFNFFRKFILVRIAIKKVFV